MTDRETWPCRVCGHKHYASQKCPEHQWTDHCPYEGLDCPPDLAERQVIAAAELVIRYGADPDLDTLMPIPED